MTRCQECGSTSATHSPECGLSWSPDYARAAPVDPADIAGAAPRPWNWIAIPAHTSGGHYLYLVDADGRKIAAIWGKVNERPHTAQLIVEAVNAAGAGPRRDATLEEIGQALRAIGDDGGKAA